MPVKKKHKRQARQARQGKASTWQVLGKARQGKRSW